MTDDIARRFAEALDREDYPAATALLSSDCQYSCRGKMLVGPKAIVESYRAAGDSATRDFDSVTYESSVSVRDGLATIDFTDHLSHRNQTFTFRCQQVITVGGDGLIVRIEHVDLPGQRAALAEYMRQVGVKASHEGEDSLETGSNNQSTG